GFRKTLELGNYELETWLMRCDILIELGENQAAIKNLFQAVEFYPENAEIEYRLAGLFYNVSEEGKGDYHLKNGLNLDPEFIIILEELFPIVFIKKTVLKIIKNHKKTSI
ncbi:MAG: tetratricopeptide (TPR) repeat protein, partial [Candidatus Latescibacterota bacterium]